MKKLARLLLDPPACGSRNMAVDEALLASAAEGVTSLRIYAWSPATLSLGYFQAAADRREHEASRDCALVRRASGGGAILHDRELTYSLTIPCADRFGGTAAAVYRGVHRSLIATLATWNVSAALYGSLPPQAQSAESASEPFLCFQRRSAEDIVVRGVKIVGSAQRRNHGALLQHGSVLLARSAFAPELPGLAEVLESAAAPISYDEFWNRWLTSLQAELGLQFTPGALSEAEERAASDWEKNRFASDEWTLRR